MKFRPIYLIVMITFLSCFLYFRNTLSIMDTNMQDWWLRESKMSRIEADSRIVIIGIDDESLQKYGPFPWPRSMHAKLINKLVKGKAKVIAFDILFQKGSGKEAMKADRQLVNAVKKAGNVVFPILGNLEDDTKGVPRAKAIETCFKELYDVSYSGHINVIPDNDDGYIRDALTKFKYKGKTIQSFDNVIYKLYQGKNKSINKPHVDKWGKATILYAGGNQSSFEEFPYSDVLSGRLSPDYFEDKIVLIGPYAVGMQDAYHVPVNKGMAMNGVEIHANIIQDYLRNSFKRKVPLGINIFLIILVALISIINLRRFSNLIYLITSVGTFAAYGYGSRILYYEGYIVSIFYPLATFILCQIVIMAYHYINQYLERKRVTNIFGRYVDKQIVSKLIEKDKNSLKLGGEKKEVSVLFVDIRGFTPLSEAATPEEVVEILNEYLTLTSQSIFKYGGTLDKFIGDATMAIFNAPIDLEDHAFMAVQAALAMRLGAEALEKSLFERFGKSVKFGIGINTGYAIVGNIGSSSRMDYTAIGDTVNTAARFESNAKPGQIIISESTYELVKDKVEVENLGFYKLKGKANEVPVFGVIGLAKDKDDKGLQGVAATTESK